MFWIRHLHAWNASICFLLSMTLNSTFVWLIWRKTPKDMRRYSVILLQTVALDMTLSIVLELTQPIYFSVGEDEFYFLNGILGALPYPIGQFLLVNLYIICYNFVVSGQSAQFIYRYLLICREYQLSLPQYFLLLCAPFSLNLATFVLLFYYIPASTDCDNYDQFAQQLTGGEAANSTLMIVNLRGSANATAQHLVKWLFYGTNAILYAVILFCNACIIRHLLKHAASLVCDQIKKRAHRLNVQLTRSLTCMTLIPFAMQALSLSEALTRMGLNAHTYQTLILVPSHWMPVLNPVVNMLTAKMYRYPLEHKIKQQIGAIVKALIGWLHKLATCVAQTEGAVAPQTNTFGASASAAG